MNYEKLASELLRALRGRRSQMGFSKRLGYRSNVAYAWESGRAWPSASSFLWILKRMGLDPTEVIRRFYGAEPHWIASIGVENPSSPAVLLDDLRGQRSVAELAKSTGFSRFSVSRWLNGDTEPRLPDFLHMIEATSLRLLDWLAAIVDPARLPSAKEAWQRLQAARQVAYEAPWSHAVLRAIELADYQRLPRHCPGWIAERIGIDPELEATSLELLQRSGQVRWRRDKWEIGEPLTVDTRADPERARQLRLHWNRVAIDRFEQGHEGTYSYNLFGVSRADLARIEELHRAYFRQLRAIVAESKPTECVALASIQLLELASGGGSPRLEES